MKTDFTLKQTARFLAHKRSYAYDSAECAEVAGAILEMAWLAARGDETVAFDMAAPLIHMIGRYDGKLGECTSAVAIDFICDQTHGLDDVIAEAYEEAQEAGEPTPWLDTSPVHPSFSVFHGGREGEYPWFTRAQWLDEVGRGETALDYWQRVDQYRATREDSDQCDPELGRI